MLEQLRGKKFDENKVSVVKASVEEALADFNDDTFDGVVAVNVMYALDDPASCLRELFRVLRRGGICAFSTTHSRTRLGPLLTQIDTELQNRGLYPELQNDYQAVKAANDHIEATIALRHSLEEYRQWVEDAGFRITRFVDATYVGTVILVHAEKP